MTEGLDTITKEEFLRDARHIRARFRVAAVTEATGFNKSTVSKYLRGELMPSVRFLQLFYEKFPKSGTNVSRETSNTHYIDSLKEQLRRADELVKSKDETIQSKNSEIARLEKTYQSLEEKLNALEINLANSIKNQQVMIRQLDAFSRQVIEWYAAGDEKKRRAENKKLDTKISELHL